jgi:hypothetical protein
VIVLECGPAADDDSGDPRDADLVRVLDDGSDPGERARMRVAVARSLGIPVEWEVGPNVWARKGGACRYCLVRTSDLEFDGTYYHELCRRAVS